MPIEEAHPLLRTGFVRRLHVAVVAPSLRILGGQAVQADRLVRAWRDDPDVSAWLVPVNPRPPRVLSFAARVKYVRTALTQLQYLPLLFRELARADVVHVFSASYSSFLLAPLPAILVARTLGKPVLFNYRSGHAPNHFARSPAARWALRSVDLNVVPSPYLVSVFSRFGASAEVIPNIVDLGRFRYRDRDPLRPRLLSTRNLEPLYNVACTVEAFRIVQARRPDATLTLVGAGRDEAALRTLVARLGLRGVTFVGRVEPDRIAELYAAHDIYVQSPNVDNMPTSILEAAASGLPVVSTEAGGVPVMVASGVNGLLAPLNDHETLAAHVLRLLDDAPLARRLALAAFDGCQRCTWAAVRDEWLRAYRGLVDRSLGRHSRVDTEGAERAAHPPHAA
jgi:L-malate glycosyltransferase